MHAQTTIVPNPWLRSAAPRPRARSARGIGAGSIALAAATLCAGSGPAAPARAASDPPMVGADISWVPQQESAGRRYSVNGRTNDLLAILKEHGFNRIRLRLFHDPAATNGYSARGFCGLEATLEMAARVKAAGLPWLLNFHYSDNWADPGKQRKPAAWRDLDFPALTNALHRYTRDALAACARRGLAPDMVQVGNEVSHGLLWPDGDLKHWDQLAGLLRAGIRAVREETPRARVMIHLALGGQNEKSRWFLDRLRERGVEFDVLGQSYYPAHHGTLEDLRQNLTDLATRYPWPLVVVEHTGTNICQTHEIVRGLPTGKGLGAFIWEPTHPRHGGLFDHEGRALPALAEYRALTNTPAPRDP